MSTCTSCNSPRIMFMYAKCNDLFVADINGHEYAGYVMEGIEPIGGGDDVQFEVCLNCGKIQGDWPIPELPLERGMMIDRYGNETPIDKQDDE